MLFKESILLLRRELFVLFINLFVPLGIIVLRYMLCQRVQSPLDGLRLIGYLIERFVDLLYLFNKLIESMQ